MLKELGEKLLFAEWPPAYGKTTSMVVYAKYIYKEKNKKCKIVIVMPNILLARLVFLEINKDDSNG